MNLRICALALPGLGLAISPTFAQTEPYRFDLQGEKLTVPAGPWRVARVLDLRPDRSRLGKVHRGLDNQLASANFTQPVAAELLQFIQAQLPGRADARPVLMRVFTLAISESIRTSSERGEAELVADFLEPQPDSSYRVVLSTGEITQRGGLDVTKHHAANLALVLQQALQKLAAQSTATAETLSHADALAGRGGAIAQRFAIQTDKPKRGVYRSFEEFRNNTPSEPEGPFTITRIEHTGKRWAGVDDVQPNYLFLDERHPARPVSTSGLWGLSDGTDILVAHQHHFYKLLPAADGRSYTFTGPPTYNPQAAGTVAAAAVAGGLVGAAIAGAAMSGSGALVPYEVHMASGRIVPLEEETPTDANGFATSTDTAAVYVYRRFNSAKEPAVALKVGSQSAIELLPRHYEAITWRDRRRELKLCAQQGSGPESCREFVPDFSQATYFECTVSAVSGEVVLRPVPAKEGLFELRRIQRLSK